MRPAAEAPVPAGSGARPGRPRLSWRFGALLYAGYAVGVLALTWPLATAPAALWPQHHDPYVFAWVMASAARRLLTAPLALFHGSAFYPHGLSLAYTEPLLVPAVLGLPGFLAGHVVLTYNLLLLLLWPLDGLAMAWAAHVLTGSRAAAALAGAVFSLSPYFSDYYLEFQMLLAAPLPVALVAWARWLEGWAAGWLALALGAFVLQALTSWYYATILALGLATLALGILALRWRGWSWRRGLPALGLGGLGTAAVLLPVAWPYVVVHRELGFERRLSEAARHSADLATFVEAGRRVRFPLLAPARHVAETSLFPGFTTFALAAASGIWLREGSTGGRWLRRTRWAVRAALGASLGVAAWAAAWRPSPESVVPGAALSAAVLCGVGLLGLRGAGHAAAGAPLVLAPADWVGLLALLGAVFALLALGPVIHVARLPVGLGPHVWLYPWLLPLRGIRVMVRFGVLALAALALLAALGLRALEARLAGRPGSLGLLRGTVGLLLAFEYAVTPGQYQRVDLAARPVDAALRADPADVAVLYVPTNVFQTDAETMVRSLRHGKRVVNGLSGFIPGLRPLELALEAPDAVFPSLEAQAALRRIYPLRYVVVRLDHPDLGEALRARWAALPAQPPPLLRPRGRFGGEDLYEVRPLPEAGLRVERAVSYEFLRGHPELRLALRPLATAGDLAAQWVDVRLNGRHLDRLPLEGPGPVALARRLSPPFRAAAPNVIALEYGYRRPPHGGDPRYRIGATGATSPVDIRIESGGSGHGGRASIQVNGRELARARRGYNLAALDPAGEVREAAAFDTFADAGAAAALARWVAALPPGTLVAGAVHDEASRQLTEAAVAALRTLGAAGDLRGRFRESHAFLGVKGSPPGSALEALGPRWIRLEVGRVEAVPGPRPSRLGFELTAFALEPG